MRASGLSIAHLIRPIVYFGALTGALTLFISLQVSPRAFALLSQTLFDIARTKSTSGLDEGIFSKLGNLTMYAEKIDHASGQLKFVLIDDKRDRASRKIITARRGVVISDDAARTITLRLHDGTIHEQIEGKYVTTDYDSNIVVMHAEDLFPQEGNEAGKSLHEMSLRQLKEEEVRVRNVLAAPPVPTVEPSLTAALPMQTANPTTPKSLEQRLRKIPVEYLKRFSMPYAAFILPLIALALGIQPPRSHRTWGATLAVLVGLIVFVLYYGVLSVGVALAEAGQLSPWIALWLPNLLASIVAVYVLSRMATERWQSIAHAIEEFLTATFIKARAHLPKSWQPT